MPNLGFKSKWFFVEGLPLAAIGFFVVLHILTVLKKRVILGRKTKLHTNLPSLVGTTLVMMCVRVGWVL
jgi:hypothetical protein